jgi:hypothetical protein
MIAVEVKRFRDLGEGDISGTCIERRLQKRKALCSHIKSFVNRIFQMEGG